MRAAAAEGAARPQPIIIGWISGPRYPQSAPEIKGHPQDFNLPARHPFAETVTQLIIGLLFISVAARHAASLQHLLLSTRTPEAPTSTRGSNLLMIGGLRGDARALGRWMGTWPAVAG